MPRNEDATRRELVDPVLYGRGWTEDLVRREKTPGRAYVVNGKPRRGRGRVDYLLCLPAAGGKPPIPVAYIEAKAEDKPAELGIQQARDYQRRFHVPFVFSTNGYRYVEWADDTRRFAVSLLADFPTPEDLSRRWEILKGFSLEGEAAIALAMPYKGGEAARYYFQDAAIRAVLEKLAGRGERWNRVLLSLATGTGKTIIAAQLLHKLAQAGQIRRALFVVDRDELRSQGWSKLHHIFGDNVQVVSTDNPRPNARILVASYQTLNISNEDDEPAF